MSAATTLKFTAQNEPWEHLFLNCTPESLNKELTRRYLQSQKEISSQGFDLTDRTVYSHQFYDQEKAHLGIARGAEQSNKVFSLRLSKCGGRLRMNVDENVEIVVVEEYTLEDAVDRFVKWRNKVLDSKGSSLASLADETGPNQQQEKPANKLALSKREQLLLGGAGTVVKGNQLADRSRQVTLQFNHLTVEGSNGTRMNLRSKNRLMSAMQNLAEQVNEVMCYLKGESDQLQKDVALIHFLLKNPRVMLSDIEVMLRAIQKCYSFTPHFVLDKKFLFNESLLKPDELKSIICFVQYSNKNNSSSSQRGGHAIHQFPIKNHTKTITVSSTSTVFVPLFRKDAPPHAVPFLDHEEYQHVLHNRSKSATDYQRHIQKLKVKHPDSYDIKTPVPNERHDFCSVCLRKFDNYKGHIRGEDHKNSVAADSLYKDIDSLIDSMNEEIQQKKARQSLDCQSESEDEVSEVYPHTTKATFQSQELTNPFTMMSTEVTANSKHPQFFQQQNNQVKNIFQKRTTFKVPKTQSKFAAVSEEVKIGVKRKRDVRDREDFPPEGQQKNFDYSRQISLLKRGDRTASQKEFTFPKFIKASTATLSVPYPSKQGMKFTDA